MTLAPVKDGSLNQRILFAVTDLGERARRGLIGAWVAGDAVTLGVALESLVRDGYLKLNAFNGLYSVTDEAIAVHDLKPMPDELEPVTATLEARPVQSSPEPVVQTSQPNKDSLTTPRETTMAKTRTCNVCEQEKSEADFYPGNSKCKPCYNARQKALKTARMGGGKSVQTKKPKNAPAAKPARKTSVPAVTNVRPVASADLYFIPRDGGVTCRVGGSGAFTEAFITQYEHEHRYTLDQLARLVEWGQSVLQEARG